MWELEDEVSELHAFERHSLSPYLSARSIHQSPVLINNIYNCNQLPAMRPKGDIGHLANLYEVPEHHVGGIRREVYHVLDPTYRQYHIFVILFLI